MLSHTLVKETNIYSKVRGNEKVVLRGHMDNYMYCYTLLLAFVFYLIAF